MYNLDVSTPAGPLPKQKRSRFWINKDSFFFMFFRPTFFDPKLRHILPGAFLGIPTIQARWQLVLIAPRHLSFLLPLHQNNLSTGEREMWSCNQVLLLPSFPPLKKNSFSAGAGWKTSCDWLHQTKNEQISSVLTAEQQVVLTGARMVFSCVFLRDPHRPVCSCRDDVCLHMRVRTSQVLCTNHSLSL